MDPSLASGNHWRNMRNTFVNINLGDLWKCRENWGLKMARASKMNFNDRNECKQFLDNNYNGHNNNIRQEKTIFYSFDTQQLVCSYSLTNAVELQVDQYSVTMVLSSSCPEEQAATFHLQMSSRNQHHCRYNYVYFYIYYHQEKGRKI